MTDAKVAVLITSGRTLKQGMAIEKGKISKDYLDAVAVCELDSNTMKSLNLKNGDVVQLTSESGETIVRSKMNNNLPKGIAFMPLGPYYNSLISSETQHSGMPSYKSVKASIKPAKDQTVLTPETMIDAIKRTVE